MAPTRSYWTAKATGPPNRSLKTQKILVKNHKKTTLKGGENQQFEEPSEVAFGALLSGSITAIGGGSIRPIIDNQMRTSS
jgi:hypothetical protein